MNKEIIWIKKKILDHVSFLVMIMSSGFLFFSSIYLFSALSARDYVVFSMLIVFASLTASFGALGSEQTLLRLSNFENGIIYLSKTLLKIVAFCVVSACLFLSFIAKNSILNMLDFSYLIYFSVIYSIQMILYNLLRLTKKFVLAQIVNNFMKLGIPLFILTKFYIESDLLILFYFGLIGLFSILFGFLSLKDISFKLVDGEGLKKEVVITCSFLFSMFVILLLNYVDKLYVSKTMNENLIASYMLMQNIFLSPLLIISSYFGFKGLVKYKASFCIEKYTSNLKVVASYSLFLIIFSLAILFSIKTTLDSFFGYEGAFYTIALLLALGIIRVVYSDLSAAMGAIGVSKQIFQVNSASLFATILLSAPFYFMEIKEINLFLVMLLILWFFRSFLYYLSLRLFK